jgi:hypothetical protein
LKPARPEREILEEILTRVREMTSGSLDYRRRIPIFPTPEPNAASMRDDLLDKFATEARLTGIGKSFSLISDGDNRITISTEGKPPLVVLQRLNELADSLGLELHVQSRRSKSAPSNTEREEGAGGVVRDFT